MKKIDLNKIDWTLIQEKHNGGVYWNKLPETFRISRTVLNRALIEGYITKILHKRVMSNDVKKSISVGRSKYLKENPDKHPWKKHSKFKSKPCEYFKKMLTENNIIFVEEYEPSDDKFYSIDVAFPNKKIGVEINGNQHYNRDGLLKDYYIDRNNFLKNIGWKIIDIHYSVVYNKDIICNLISQLKSDSLDKAEYEKYTLEHFNRKLVKKEKRRNHCIDCGAVIDKDAKRCVKCSTFSRRIVIRPSKDELKLLIENNNWRKIGRMFGVSDSAVTKWAKQYEII